MAVEAATATVKTIRESIVDDDDDVRRTRELCSRVTEKLGVRNDRFLGRMQGAR